jgi:hypothetical protein
LHNFRASATKSTSTGSLNSSVTRKVKTMPTYYARISLIFAMKVSAACNICFALRVSQVRMEHNHCVRMQIVPAQGNAGIQNPPDL